MTAPTTAPAAPIAPALDKSGSAGNTEPTVRQRMYRLRWLLAAGVVLLLGCVSFVWYDSTIHGGDLDPRSYDPAGTHALSVLLGQRGVTVTTDTDVSAALAAATSGSTLVVVRPDYLNSAQLRQIANTPADLVVVGADQTVVNDLGTITASSAISAGVTGDTETVQPDCPWPIADISGSAQLGAVVYDGGTAQRCYPGDDGGYGLVSIEQGSQRITLLGDPTPLENATLADDGNAALALGLLDTHPRVIWLLPLTVSPDVAASGQRDITSLFPDRLKTALIQLVIAVVIIALWRGRRFGRLVREDLPVVVRRAESVVGRARLYQRARAHDSAAQALRAGSRDRLSSRLGFGISPAAVALVEVVAARSQRRPDDVAALLYGATPVDDHALVALTHALSVLEQEVSRA